MNVPFELYPAIDIRGGRCVRLYQGDYDRETVYADDPVRQAVAFAEQGCSWVHVVDLDAARTGEPVNRRVIERLAAAIDVPVQVGGGVRSADAAKVLFDAGVARVVVGTAALEDPDLVYELAATHRVAVGLDVRGREVAVRGWREGSGRDLHEVASQFAQAGVEALVVTQISRDGTLEGPDVEGLCALLAIGSVPVIASGGVGRTADISMLTAIEVQGRRLAGVIVGRAIYEGAVSVPDALRAIQSRNGR